MPATIGARSSSLGALKRPMRQVGSLPSLLSPASGGRRAQAIPESDETPSTGRSLYSRGSSSSSRSPWAASSSGSSPSGLGWPKPAREASMVPGDIAFGKESPVQSPGRRRASMLDVARVTPLDRIRAAKRKTDFVGEVQHSASTTCLLSALGAVVLDGPAEARITKTNAKDVSEVCKLAKLMRVQVSEMQQHFVLFREHARIPEEADSDSLVRNGRLTKQQFHELVAKHLYEGSKVESALSIDRAFQVADAAGAGAISFEQFAMWMINHQTFDPALHIDAREREMRGLAREYKTSVVEVDKYKRVFDSLDKDGNGRIADTEFEEVLFRCGNVPRDIGLSDTRRRSLWSAADPRQRGFIDFEEFLVFNLRYLAKGTGLDKYYEAGRRVSLAA